MLIRHSDWCTYKNGYNRVHSPPQRLQLQALIAYQNHVQPNECIRQIKITLQFIPLLFVQRVPAANVCWLRHDVVFNSIRSAIESFHVTYRCHCIVDASLFLHRRFCARASYPWHFDVKATMAELTIEWDAYGFHIPFTAFASDSNGSNSKWRKEIRIVRLLPAKRAHRIPSIRRKWGQEWARTLFIVFSVWLNALWSFLADFPPHRLYSFHWIVCELNGSAKLLIRVYFSIQTNAFVLLYNVMENCGLWMCSGSFSFTTTWSFRSSQNDNHLQFKNTVDWMPNMQPYVRLKKDAGAHSMAHNTSSHTCRCV